MPAKHQPDLIYLRYVPLWKVHIFTLVQLTCLVLLWVIKASAAAVVFPMMVMKPATAEHFYILPFPRMSQLFIVIQNIYCSSAIKVKQRLEYFVSNKSCVYNLKLNFFCLQVLALVFVRKLLDFFFSKRELSYLDDIMPESKKKKEDDKKKKEREKLVNSQICSKTSVLQAITDVKGYVKGRDNNGRCDLKSVE